MYIKSPEGRDLQPRLSPQYNMQFETNKEVMDCAVLCTCFTKSTESNVTKIVGRCKLIQYIPR